MDDLNRLRRGSSIRMRSFNSDPVVTFELSITFLETSLFSNRRVVFCNPGVPTKLFFNDSLESVFEKSAPASVFDFWGELLFFFGKDPGMEAPLVLVTEPSRIPE